MANGSEALSIGHETSGSTPAAASRDEAEAEAPFLKHQAITTSPDTTAEEKMAISGPL